MALHRDIFWVGRQWTVTGYGLQAVDQKLQGRFDIEAERLWDDGLPESLNAGGWLNAEDFAKALSVARGRHPQPPQRAAPPQPASPRESIPSRQDSPPGAPPRPVVQGYAMRIEHWPAKFLRPWRARVRP